MNCKLTHCGDLSKQSNKHIIAEDSRDTADERHRKHTLESIPQGRRTQRLRSSSSLQTTSRPSRSLSAVLPSTASCLMTSRSRGSSPGDQVHISYQPESPVTPQALRFFVYLFTRKGDLLQIMSVLLQKQVAGTERSGGVPGWRVSLEAGTKRRLSVPGGQISRLAGTKIETHDTSTEAMKEIRLTFSSSDSL